LKVLLDENMPHQLRRHLSGYDVFTAVYVGFGGFTNGELLRAAEAAGFDVLITGDLSLEYQQNLTARKIAIVSLPANSWRIVADHLPAVSEAIRMSSPGTFARVDFEKHGD
jgi:hypothetical protein